MDSTRKLHDCCLHFRLPWSIEVKMMRCSDAEKYLKGAESSTVASSKVFNTIGLSCRQERQMRRKPQDVHIVLTYNGEFDSDVILKMMECSQTCSTIGTFKRCVDRLAFPSSWLDPENKESPKS